MRHASLVVAVLVLGWGLSELKDRLSAQDTAPRAPVPDDPPPAMLPSMSDLNRLARQAAYTAPQRLAAPPVASASSSPSESPAGSGATWGPSARSSTAACPPPALPPAPGPSLATPAPVAPAPLMTSAKCPLPGPGPAPSPVVAPAPPPLSASAAPSLEPGPMPAAAPPVSRQNISEINQQAPALPPPSQPLPPAVPGASAAAPAVVGLPVGPQSPLITLEKVGPASVALGKPLAYEIVARNTGNIAVTHVHVEEELPGTVQFLSAEPRPEGHGEGPSWDLGTLEPGAERHIKIEVQPQGEGELKSRATATFSVSAAFQTTVTQPRLTLTQTGPENAQVGEQILLQIQVSNTGTGPATKLFLHEHLPAGLSHEAGNQIDAELGALAPGESKTIPLQITATHAGAQTCQVSATAEGDVHASTQTTIQVTEPALTLQKVGPQRRYLNREAEYHLDVANPGTAPAVNVRISDTLPDGLEFISASDGGTIDPATRTVSWKFTTLAPGQKQNLSLKVVPRAPGDLVCRAVAQADRGLEAKAESAMHAEGIPALLLEVADQDDPIEVGAETTYEIRVMNQGTSPSTGLRITAMAPVGMAIRSATGPSANHVDGQQVIFEPLPQLAPKADVVYKVRVVGQQPGDLRFKVQLMDDHLTQPVTAEESTRVYSDTTNAN